MRTHRRRARRAAVRRDRAGAARLEVDGDEVNIYAGARIDGNDIVVIGRRGGPEFLDSELARLGHLVSLAASLARP